MTSELRVDAIKNTAGTDALTIDSSGRITKQQQVSFLAYKSSAGNVTYSNTDNISADMTSTEFNAGSHYQTSGSDVGKFIAPITGYYCLGCNLFNNTGSTTRVSLYRESDGLLFAGQGQRSQYNDINTSSAVYLTANDKVYVRSIYASIIYHGASHSYFYGYLIG